MTSATRRAALVVAIDSFTVELPGESGRGVPVFARRGNRYRADDPLVLANPRAFAPDGLSDGEVDQLRRALRDRKAAATAKRQAEAAKRDGTGRNYPSGESFSLPERHLGPLWRSR